MIKSGSVIFSSYVKKHELDYYSDWAHKNAVCTLPGSCVYILIFIFTCIHFSMYLYRIKILFLEHFIYETPFFFFFCIYGIN